MSITLTDSTPNTWTAPLVALAEELPTLQYFRVPHDFERVNVNAEDLRFRYDGSRGPVRDVVTKLGAPLPEVFRLEPDHHTVIDCSFQKLWRNLNPDLSASKWATLLGNTLAWCNKSGFPGHYNCIEQKDSALPFPRFDQPRVCGGALLAGVEQGGYLLIDSMLNTLPAPSVSQVLPKIQWWYWGTSITPDGKINMITRLGLDGYRHPVRIPLLTAQPVKLPLDELHKLPKGMITHPTWTPST